MLRNILLLVLQPANERNVQYACVILLLLSINKSLKIKLVSFMKKCISPITIDGNISVFFLSLIQFKYIFNRKFYFIKSFNVKPDKYILETRYIFLNTLFGFKHVWLVSYSERKQKWWHLKYQPSMFHLLIVSIVKIQQFFNFFKNSIVQYETYKFSIHKIIL